MLKLFGIKNPFFLLTDFFIRPEETWSKLLPAIEFSVEGNFQFLLKSFIRSKNLIPIILEMNQTVDDEAFNKKWTGKVIEAELEQLTEFDAIDQLDHFTF